LRILVSSSLPWPAIDTERPFRGREQGCVTLAESQREAVRLALRSKVLVTGGPGVGKTTLVNSSWLKGMNWR
jgi:exodeoxyribonuclease V alpha subunit